MSAKPSRSSIARRSGRSTYSRFGRSFSENRRPDADKRRSFLDRDHEIVRHSDGEMRKSQFKFFLKRVAQFTKFDKIFSRSFGFFGKRRDGHQSFDRQSIQREKRLHFGSCRFRLETELTPLTCYINLQQNSRMQSF